MGTAKAQAANTAQTRVGPARAQEGADGERHEPAHDRNPDDPTRPALLHAIRELPADEHLRGQPGAERERDAPQTPAPGEHERARERKGERQEGGEAAGLRDGEDVREEREELGHEQDSEGEERAAEDELSPAPAGGEAREWDRKEPCDDDRPAAGDRLGREAERVAEDVERVPVVLELDRAARGARLRGRVIRYQGEKPGEIEEEGSGQGDECEGCAPDEGVECPDDDHAGYKEAPEQQGDERQVARMDHRECERGAREGRNERPGPPFDECEGEREDRRCKEDPARGRRQGKQLEGPGGSASAATGQSEVGDRRNDQRRAPSGTPEHGCPSAVGEQKSQRHQHGRQVERDVGDVGAGQPRDQRDSSVPERERVARMQAPVLELVHRPERGQRIELGQLAHAGQVKEPVAFDGARRPPDEAGERDGRDENGEPGAAIGSCVHRDLAAPGTNPDADRQRGSDDDSEHDECRGERRAHEEEDAEREEDDHEADGEGRGDRDAQRAGQAERAQDQPARQQKDEEGPHREPQRQPGPLRGKEAHQPEREERSPSHEHRQGLDAGAGVGGPGG